MRISDWSSDVCSSDLADRGDEEHDPPAHAGQQITPDQHPFEPGKHGPSPSPIAPDAASCFAFGADAHGASCRNLFDVRGSGTGPPPHPTSPVIILHKSEEGRGGKECVSTSRSRWERSN